MIITVGPSQVSLPPWSSIKIPKGLHDSFPAIAVSNRYSGRFSSDVPTVFGWCKGFAVPDDGDVGDLKPPPPSPYPSQIGVYLRGVHPRPSQIGVGFSIHAQIGVELSEVLVCASPNQQRVATQLANG